MRSFRIHKEKTGSERRYVGREAFYQANEVRIKFEISGPSKNLPVVLNVLNLNSFGVLAFTNSQAHRSTLVPGTKIKKMDIFYSRSKVGTYRSGIILHSKEKDGRLEIGIRFDIETRPADFREDERGRKRVCFNPAFSPTAICKSLINYDETYHFDVLDISNEGARLKTSPRNRLLLVGLELKSLLINLPTVGSFETSGTVRYTYPDPENNKIILGIEFQKKPADFDKSIVRYLVAFADQDDSNLVQALRDAGFHPKFVKSHVEYSYSSSLKDYQSVLKLRKIAYLKAGKVEQEVLAADMSDIYDLRSRIVVARSRGEIIGSVRCTFCNHENDRFELEESISLPKQVGREDSLEISRLCVDTRYEGTDLVHGLIERVVSLALQLGAKYVITSCTEDKLDYYRKIGFVPTSGTFTLKTLNDVPHYAIIADTRAASSSFRINPLYWHYAYSRIVGYLKGHGFLSDSRVHWAKKLIITMLLPAVRFIGQLTKKRADK